MSIQKAKFMKSAVSVKDCLVHRFPEYAFIGRSNVGKSSLINALTNQKELARTSAKPGKTQIINQFQINNDWFLVDLPGYGYTVTGKTDLEGFNEMILQYIEKRANLNHLFVLVDSRHSPQSKDVEFMAWLARHEVAFSIIFTKADKLSKAQIQKGVQTYKKVLSEYISDMPEYFITSAVSKMGKEDIVNSIEELNKSWGK